MRTAALRFALLLAATCLLPRVAEAQDISDRGLRLGAHLALGFGGEYDLHVSHPALGSTSTEADADTSIGFGVRADLPILDWLALGGFFEANTFEPEGRETDRRWGFDFDVYARFRWVFDVDVVYLEPYVLLPFGLSIGLFDEGEDEAWPGFNTGAMAGLSVLTDAGFGGYIEAGWRHHQVFHSYDVPLLADDAEARLTLNQFAMNLGFLYQF